MSMQDIGGPGVETLAHSKERREIAWVRKSVDWQAAKPERKSRRKRGQRALRPRAAGKRIRDDAHPMPARGLLACKVEQRKRPPTGARSTWTILKGPAPSSARCENLRCGFSLEARLASLKSIAFSAFSNAA